MRLVYHALKEFAGSRDETRRDMGLCAAFLLREWYRLSTETYPADINTDGRPALRRDLSSHFSSSVPPVGADLVRSTARNFAFMTLDGTSTEYLKAVLLHWLTVSVSSATRNVGVPLEHTSLLILSRRDPPKIVSRGSYIEFSPPRHYILRIIAGK